MRRFNGKMIVGQPRELVIILAFFAFMLLPARFYTSMSLSQRATSALVVNYLNGVDLAALVICFLFLIMGRHSFPGIRSILVLCVFCTVGAINILGLINTDQIPFAAEVISKMLMMVTAVVVADCVKHILTARQKELLFLIPIFVLVVAAFFLQKYGNYGTTNRGGTIGFGSNETAMFACMLIAMALTMTLIPAVRAVLIVVAFFCVMTVSSRRGLIVAVGILGIHGLLWVCKKKRMPRKKTVIVGCFGVLALLLGGIVFLDRIVAMLGSMPLVTRILYTERTGGSFFDLSNRLSIVKNCLKTIENHPLLGFFGCDKLFAQEGNTHAHNLLLQIMVTYGCPAGAIICLFFTVSFFRALRLLLVSVRRENSGNGTLAAAIFYVIYYIFDMFGYLLWNQKGLVWVAVSVLIVNEEYQTTFRNRRTDQKENVLTNG